MNRRSRGFTLTELIIVIVVIGILAGITIIGLNRYQGDARDSRRQSSATVIAEALEKYYDANGEYPSCVKLQESANTLTTTTLKGLSQQTLVAPSAPAGTTNSIACSTLSPSSTDFFEYEGDGSDACLTGSSCLAYKLKYKEEGSGTIAVIEGRNNTDIDTSGSLAINTTANQFSTIDVSWNAVTNAASYTIQRADDSGFTNNLVGITAPGSTTTSFTISGLTPGNTYYVRAAPYASNGLGNWSNVRTVAVPHIARPSISVTSPTPTDINVTWPAVSGATSYIIQRDTSVAFSAPQEWTQSTPNKTFSDSSPSTEHFFRVKAVAVDDSSDWTAIHNLRPTVPQPTADPTLSAAMNGTNAEGTANASCAFGTVQYQLRYHSENTATLGAYSAYTAWSGTNVLSVAALQGYRYMFQAQARCFYLSTASTVRTSTEASTVRTVDALAAPTMVVNSTTWGNGSTHNVNYTWTCPANMTVIYLGYSYGGWMATGFNWSDGVNYYNTWGSNDKWTFASGYGSGSKIRYYTDYYCGTVYTGTVSPLGIQDITIV